LSAKGASNIPRLDQPTILFTASGRFARSHYLSSQRGAGALTAVISQGQLRRNRTGDQPGF